MSLRTMNDVESAIRALEDFKNSFSGNVDFHRNRIINAGESKDPFDYVIRQELDTQGNILFAEIERLRSLITDLTRRVYNLEN